MPEGHDTTIEVSNIMSFVLYTQILKQSVLKPASLGITLNGKLQIFIAHNNSINACTNSIIIPAVIELQHTNSIIVLSAAVIELEAAFIEIMCATISYW